MCLAQVLATMLQIEISANAPGKTTEDSLRTWASAPTWQTWMEVWTPG